MCITVFAVHAFWESGVVQTDSKLLQQVASEVAEACCKANGLYLGNLIALRYLLVSALMLLQALRTKKVKDADAVQPVPFDVPTNLVHHQENIKLRKLVALSQRLLKWNISNRITAQQALDSLKAIAALD